PTHISPLSLHDALPIYRDDQPTLRNLGGDRRGGSMHRYPEVERATALMFLALNLGFLILAILGARREARRQPPLHPDLRRQWRRSEEHTSELQSLAYLV